MKFTYYTIIGKDPNLLKGHIKNIKKYAGFDNLTCDKEFLIIIYRNENIPKETTKTLMDICDSNEIRRAFYDEPHNAFLLNLYACWNLGYELSDPGFVFRGGSDQFFSKDSFLHLFELAVEHCNLKDSKTILQANTIENIKRSPGSRHILADLGDTFENFKLKEFEDLCIKISDETKLELLTVKDALKTWGHPTGMPTSLGYIDREDGCSWLMKKSDWEKYGPMPPIQGGVTGDVLIHDWLQTAGYKELITRDCITYHFVRGESQPNCQE